MSTDTAVYVTKKILDGTSLEKLKFVEEIEFEDKDGCFVGLPFRYVVEDGKVITAKGLKDFVLKHQKLI
jgi:ribosome biogenesis SPOUT family RNA methylase Rps3